MSINNEIAFANMSTAEIIRIVNDNVVVEFLNRRPNGEKRGNYKLKDLK